MRRDGILSAGNKPARERPQRVTPKTLRLRWLSSGGGARTGKTQSQPLPRTNLSSPTQENGRKKREKEGPEDGCGRNYVPGQYKESIKLATEKIDLASLDINGLSARRAITGAQIFEIGGPDNKRKTDALAE